MKLAIRDLFWLIVVVAFGTGWYLDHFRAASAFEGLDSQHTALQARFDALASIANELAHLNDELAWQGPDPHNLTEILFAELPSFSVVESNTSETTTRRREQIIDAIRQQRITAGRGPAPSGRGIGGGRGR